MTSMIVNAGFAPQQAIPASPVVIYKDRPLLDQVDAKKVAKELLTKTQYQCLAKLLGKESAWRASAKNPTSSAKGIGQLLDATYRNLGMKHSEASVPQLVATLAYIHRRHKTPCHAWSHFERNLWY
jgi:membrane-bound lytic murein transglycosylase MltF